MLALRRLRPLYTCAWELHTPTLLRPDCCLKWAPGVQVTVPTHRMTPLKNAWLSLYQPVTENLKLDMRMNLKTRKVMPEVLAC